MLTIIDNPNAPTTYDYKISVPEGGRIEITNDGGAVILDRDKQPIAAVQVPWAKDAKSKQIQTWFTTDGMTLTQHIRHNVRGVVYPIIADPSVSFGWRIYATLSKNETKYLAARPNQAGAYYALPGGAGCWVIGAGFLGYTCGAYLAIRSATLMDSISRAANSNGCLQVAIPYTIYSPATFWTSFYSISFSVVRC